MISRWKFFATTSLAALFFAARPASLFACAVCYGQSDAPMAKGLSWAIFTLGGVVVCVLAGVITFFVHMAKNSAALNEPESTPESPR